MLEHRIADWRATLLRSRSARTVDADELEARLRGQLDELRAAGLDEDEAFLLATRRLGETEPAARAGAEKAWRRAATAMPSDRPGETGYRDAAVAFALAVAAAVAVKLPEAFGLRLDGPDAEVAFYLHNLPLFVLFFLAAFFAWKRDLPGADIARLALPFILGLAIMNVYPFVPGGHTEALAALHLPFALWFAIGFAHCGARWRDHDRRMDFVRFSGEWFILYVLIALGGGVLVAVTMLIFESIGLDAETLVGTWVLPCGAAGAVIIAAWLAEWRQGVAGNLAPMLTVLFTPLFTLLLLAFLGTAVLTGGGIGVERDVLIGFDLLLVLVVALLLFANSTRDPGREPGAFDVLQLVLAACALLADALALAAILARISEFGFSPNRLAALGLNLVLVANLGRAALLHARFLAGRGGFDAVLRWQTACLPAYAAWAAVVVVAFPPLFRFA